MRVMNIQLEVLPKSVAALALMAAPVIEPLVSILRPRGNERWVHRRFNRRAPKEIYTALRRRRAIKASRPMLIGSTVEQPVIGSGAAMVAGGSLSSVNRS